MKTITGIVTGAITMGYLWTSVAMADIHHLSNVTIINNSSYTGMFGRDSAYQQPGPFEIDTGQTKIYKGITSDDDVRLMIMKHNWKIQDVPNFMFGIKPVPDGAYGNPKKLSFTLDTSSFWHKNISLQPQSFLVNCSHGDCPLTIKISDPNNVKFYSDNKVIATGNIYHIVPVIPPKH